QGTEPSNNHGAELRCYLRDPDGYLIEVSQTLRGRRADGPPPAGQTFASDAYSPTTQRSPCPCQPGVVYRHFLASASRDMRSLARRCRCLTESWLASAATLKRTTPPTRAVSPSPAKASTTCSV